MDWGQGWQWCGKLPVATWISTLYQSIHLTNFTLQIKRNPFYFRLSFQILVNAVIRFNQWVDLINLSSALLTDRFHHVQQNIAMVQGLRKWRSEILWLVSEEEKNVTAGLTSTIHSSLTWPSTLREKKMPKSLWSKNHTYYLTCKHCCRVQGVQMLRAVHLPATTWTIEISSDLSFFLSNNRACPQSNAYQIKIIENCSICIPLQSNYEWKFTKQTLLNQWAGAVLKIGKCCTFLPPSPFHTILETPTTSILWFICLSNKRYGFFLDLKFSFCFCFNF